MELNPQLPAITTEVQDLLESRSRINKAFRDLAVYETASIDDAVAVMLDAKLREVKQQRPDLTDVEAYAVAGRLLKQLILVYKSALYQLLP